MLRSLCWQHNNQHRCKVDVCFDKFKPNSCNTTQCKKKSAYSTACLHLNKFMNSNAGPWVSTLHLSNLKLYISDPLFCSPSILIYPTSFDLCLYWLCFLSIGHCCKQWRNKTPFDFLSGPLPSHVHLFEGLSVAKNHGFG